jgi:endonuclease/exonuclease/phosphatase family metal-dependent hydrolase
MRIATFNILNGRSPDDDRVDVGRFAQAVRRLDADVLALQEVDRNQPRSSGADLTSVAAQVMGAVDHQFVAALAGTPGATWMAATGEEQPDAAAYGIALLSRLPVHAWEVVRLGSPPTRVPMWFRGSRRPEMLRDEPRVGVAAEVETSAGPLRVVNTHLSFVRWWGHRQLRTLVRSVSDGRPLVLMGDLNMGPRAVAQITGMRPLAFGPTFPAHRPCFQLDHVMASGEVGRVAGVEVVRMPLSDHLAVCVDLV